MGGGNVALLGQILSSCEKLKKLNKYTFAQKSPKIVDKKLNGEKCPKNFFAPTKTRKNSEGPKNRTKVEKVYSEYRFNI